MNLQLMLAWRYLNGRKLRSFLTTLAVIFGVMVIFGMNIILPTMLESFQANMMAASDTVDLTITHRSGSGFDANTLQELAGIEGIRAASAILERSVNLPADFVDGDPERMDRVTVVRLIGIDPQTAQSLHTYLLKEGGRLPDGNEMGTAVISQSLADAFGVGPGETISLPSTRGLQTLQIIGILPPRTAPGNEEVLVSLSQAQQMADQAGQVNIIEVTLISLDENRRQATTEAIRAALGSEFEVGAEHSDSEMFASLKVGQAALNMFGSLALFMGGFIIFNTFRTVVAERRRDIGMLRALGAKRNTITGMILVEGLLQGLVGSVLGLLLGYLFAAGILLLAEEPINQFLNLPMSSPVVSPSLVVICILLGVGITILAGLVPARSASHVTPLDALRPSVAEVEFKRRTTGSFIAGVVLLGLSVLILFTGNMGLITLGGFLFLIGLILVAPGLLRPITWLFGRLTALIYARQGISDLAQGNLTRQPARATTTASATMIGLAIVVALGGLSTSLNGLMGTLLHRSLGSDYLFIPQSVSVWSSDMGSGADFIVDLQAIEGVGDISSLRYSSSALDGNVISVLGINPETFPKVSGLDFKQGDESAFSALATGRNMIVNSAFMLTFPLQVGDVVELATPGGPQRYTIVAQGSDLLNAKVVTVFISQSNLAADFGRTDDVFIQLNLLPGVDAARVEEQIKAVARDFPQYTVIAGKQYIDQMLELLSSVFAGMYFMLAFLAFPSFIAMLNTLTIGVLERRREIGMIRAVGGTRKQVRRMVMAEALLLAAVGTAFGLLSGLYLGYAIVKGMSAFFPMAYTFPFTGIVAGITIGLLFGALAAIIPSRQASRLPVVEALRYE